MRRTRMLKGLGNLAGVATTACPTLMRMNEIGVVALYATASLVLLVLLAIPIAVHRTRTGISHGSGDSRELYLAIRAHGNAAEWLPLFLIGLFVLATQGPPLWQLHALGAGMIVARVLHAHGLIRSHAGRALGIIGTLLAYAALALALGFHA